MTLEQDFSTMEPNQNLGKYTMDLDLEVYLS